MVIHWRKEARVQLREIYNYHQQVASLSVARKMRKQIEKTIDRLLIFPNMGSVELKLKQTDPVYRSIVAHRNNKIVYRISKNTIFITGIWDCRQDPQRMTEEVVQTNK